MEEEAAGGQKNSAAEVAEEVEAAAGHTLADNTSVEAANSPNFAAPVEEAAGEAGKKYQAGAAEVAVDTDTADVAAGEVVVVEF